MGGGRAGGGVVCRALRVRRARDPRAGPHGAGGVVVVCRGVVRDVGGSWVGAARAVRAALGGEIAQETPWVDLEALVLH